MPRTPSSNPYGSFNFQVVIGGEAGGGAGGGFSEVSGLNSETTVADYRDSPGQPLKGRPRHTVVLKRGSMASATLRAWLATAGRKPGPGVPVTIIRQDRASGSVRRWVLHGAHPVKWTGPTLAAKGGGDVAMEELVLTCEGLDPA